MARTRAGEPKEVKEFAESLKNSAIDGVRSVILFGSVARGDEQPDSDIDILVILGSDKPAIREKLRNVAYEVMEKNGFSNIITLHFQSFDHFENLRKGKFSFYETIQNEGRPLWKAA